MLEEQGKPSQSGWGGGGGGGRKGTDTTEGIFLAGQWVSLDLMHNQYTPGKENTHKIL